MQIEAIYKWKTSRFAGMILLAGLISITATAGAVLPANVGYTVSVVKLEQSKSAIVLRQGIPGVVGQATGYNSKRHQTFVVDAVKSGDTVNMMPKNFDDGYAIVLTPETVNEKTGVQTKIHFDSSSIVSVSKSRKNDTDIVVPEMAIKEFNGEVWIPTDGKPMPIETWTTKLGTFQLQISAVLDF